MNIPIEVIIKEAEILKVNPQPGEVLFFKFRGDEFATDDVDALGRQLRVFFPNNKVIVMTLPDGHDVELTTVSNQDIVDPQPAKDCSQPTSYCDNCNCGKKERIEGEKE